jgi:hypothetical protein
MRLTKNICLCLIATMLMIAPAFAQEQDTSTMDNLNFLLGSWKTKSEFSSNGVIAYGTLTYEKVLAGAWVRVTFIGDHPTGRLWEAHGYIGLNPEGEGFKSYIIFGPGEPAEYSGLMINGSTFRLETNFNGMTSGIDYIPQDDGTVYQENWVMDEQGSRRITLKTWYTPLEE